MSPVEKKREYGNYFQKPYPKLNKIFHKACMWGDLNKIRYLLTSEDIEKKPAVCIKDLINSINNNHLDVVRYLLTSPELSKHVDVHANKDELFFTALLKNDTKMLEFFILDMHIEKTSSVLQQLEKYQELFNMEHAKAQEIFSKAYIIKNKQLLDSRLSSSGVAHKRNKV